MMENGINLEKALQGKYYIGHTPVISIGGTNAWAGLYNPSGSGVNLYICTFTVSNYSSTPFQTQIWLNSKFDFSLESPSLSSTNTAKTPGHKPSAFILYAQNVSGSPKNGTSLFSRVAQATSTASNEMDGKIVIPPGGSFVVFLFSPSGTQQIKTEVAFGWSED